MRLTGVDHLAFTVSDLDRSVEWYCVNLGFEPFVRYTNELSIMVCRDPDNIQIELCTTIREDVIGTSIHESGALAVDEP